ncbi:MAG TPA: hypothetical protein VHB21_22440 [Minicystis sp.]|nr:hypothetical protein [Minicystis sp.]
MNMRVLGLAVAIGVPVVAGGAYAVRSLTRTDAVAPAPVADDGPREPAPAQKKKHHHRHHDKQAKREQPAAAPQGETAIDGTFQRYLVAPHGDALGLLLGDGTVVRLPHGAAADPSLKPGDGLHVEGKVHKAAQAAVVMHAKVSRAGQVIYDGSAVAKSERGDAPKLEAMTATGKVVALIPGRKGLAGVALDDGTTVTFHGKDAADLALNTGDAISVEGRGGSYPIGRGMLARSIKLPNGETKELVGKKGA